MLRVSALRKPLSLERLSHHSSRFVYYSDVCFEPSALDVTPVESNVPVRQLYDLEVTSGVNARVKCIHFVSHFPLLTDKFGIKRGFVNPPLYTEKDRE